MNLKPDVYIRISIQNLTVYPRVKPFFFFSLGSKWKVKISSISLPTSALKAIILNNNSNKKYAKEPLGVGPNELTTA